MDRSTLHKLKWVTKVATDGSFKGGETRVAVLLADYCNLKTSRCFPAQQTLAKRLNLSSRHVNTLIQNLKKKGYIRLIKRGDNKSGSNQYQIIFGLIDNDPDIRKYASIKQEKLQLKNRKYTSYETNKETIYKTKEDEERELLGKVSFVKKGMYTQRISQVDVQEMLKRGWITEQEFKNYG
mgnify:CR=1 FL=1